MGLGSRNCTSLQAVDEPEGNIQLFLVPFPTWCQSKLIVPMDVTSLQSSHEKFRQYLNHLKVLSKMHWSKVYRVVQRLAKKV